MEKRRVDVLSIPDSRQFAETLDRQTKKLDQANMRLVFIPDTLDRKKLTDVSRISSTNWLRREGLTFDDLLRRLRPSGIGWKGSYEQDSLEIFSNGAIRVLIGDDSFLTPIDANTELNSYSVVQYPVIFLRFVNRVMGLEGYDCGGWIEMICDKMSGVNLRPYHPDNLGHRRTLVSQDSDHLIYQHHLRRDFAPDIEARELLKRFYADFQYKPDAIPLWDPEHNCFSIDTDPRE